MQYLCNETREEIESWDAPKMIPRTARADLLATLRVMERMSAIGSKERADAHLFEFHRERVRKAQIAAREADSRTAMVEEDLQIAQRRIRNLESEVAYLKSLRAPDVMPAAEPSRPPEPAPKPRPRSKPLYGLEPSALAIMKRPAPETGSYELEER